MIMEALNVVYYAALLLLLCRISEKMVQCEDESEAQDFYSNFPREVLEDAELEVDGLISKYGYPVEKHYIQTQDGYTLKMFRIPKPNAQPFLLQHGLLDSAATFIMMGPNVSLGYYLFDAGYDVWLGNTRGNYYSRKHKKFDPDMSKEFWNYSFHEMGIYDMPAMVDYILEKTEFKKIAYIGHSQGGNNFATLLSKKPQYNEKFLLIHALAPAVFLKNMPAKIVQLLAKYFQPIQSAFYGLGIFVFGEKNSIIHDQCTMDMRSSRFCWDLVCLLQGPDLNELNKTMMPVVWNHFPAGSSIKQFSHFAQLTNSGTFQEFDYGKLRNVIRYGQPDPPIYNLSKITAPVVLYYGSNDFLVSPENVEIFSKHLPNVRGMFKVENFNHLDLVWAIDAKKLVYEKLLEVTRDFIAGNLSAVVV